MVCSKPVEGGDHEEVPGSLPGSNLRERADGKGHAGTGEGRDGCLDGLRQESVDALEKILQGHAHLMMPGGSIEIREFLPMPGT
jgi:hypothetical protein